MAFISVSQAITAIMLFLQFVLYLSSFVGTKKIEIPGAVLEPCQIKVKQLSPDILKFSTKHKDNPFTLNCSMFPCTFCLYFMPACVDWVLIFFGAQVTKKKWLVWPMFALFFMTMVIVLLLLLLFYFDSLHARLNSLYVAWSYKKKKNKKDYRLQKIFLERTYS